mgnify:CR=1 FL=1
MIFASRGGKTKELLPIVDICKAKGVSIITVTENMESPLAQAAALGRRVQRVDPCGMHIGDRGSVRREMGCSKDMAEAGGAFRGVGGDHSPWGIRIGHDRKDL